MSIDLAILGTTSQTDDGVPKIQAVSPIGDTDTDVESFGEIDQFQALGVTSFPWPKTAEGYAEGAIARNVGNRDAILVGGRDTRTAKAIGKGKPGDTILHSTGPTQAAQVQCKEKRRQVVLVTKRKNGEGILVNLDGEGDVIQIMAFGSVFELSPAGVTMSNGKATIALQGGNICLMGNVVLGSKPNPAMKFMMGPPTGSPGGAASVPLMAVPGITPGL
jgi:hypothetical protein